ncbi:unnamed protein product [Trichogramma brassicae]|uniref:WH2 domain-containing protein n=1 Tax=Trichogramma brassicae TaxID=86971 RepID=A0A6H5IHY0_9HYME|nr:unnamed protein product [Trichogramma brassicae]
MLNEGEEGDKKKPVIVPASKASHENGSVGKDESAKLNGTGSGTLNIPPDGGVRIISVTISAGRSTADLGLSYDEFHLSSQRRTGRGANLRQRRRGGRGSYTHIHATRTIIRTCAHEQGESFVGCIAPFESREGPCCNRLLTNLKDVLHRCDRAMIYVFIAATYFPWLNHEPFEGDVLMPTMRILVWIMAAVGIIYQQIFHEQYKWLETTFYVIMGVGPSFAIVGIKEYDNIPELKWGGLAYLLGIVFFKADGRIPCAHAIWHLFVAAGAGFHYHAILQHLYPDADSPILASGERLLGMFNQQHQIHSHVDTSNIKIHQFRSIMKQSHQRKAPPLPPVQTQSQAPPPPPNVPPQVHRALPTRPPPPAAAPVAAPAPAIAPVLPPPPPPPPMPVELPKAVNAPPPPPLPSLSPNNNGNSGSSNDIKAPVPAVDPRSMLMESIRSGIPLKKINKEETKSPTPKDTRSNLLDEIRQGITLKPVANEPRPNSATPNVVEGGLAAALTRALAERSRAMYSESEDSSDFSDNDDEWDD